MASLFEKLIRPALFRSDAESAHEAGMNVLRFGMASEAVQRITARRYCVDFPFEIERFGLKFPNPIGIAAGFDKNALVVDQLASLGFGSVEVGTLTFRPQPGNDKPRMFRLPKDEALVNRLGFNNEGVKAAVERLAKIKRKCIVGVNIGKNKEVPNDEAVENYLAAFELVHPFADYIAINISSPNTPGLRDLQQADSLDLLLGSIQKRNDELGAKPILVKIAPDLTNAEIEAAVDVCMGKRVAGMIATNTTISRSDLVSPNVGEIGAGGLSGRPLRKRSTEVIRAVYRASHGKMPVVGVGGIFHPVDAFEKIAAGASLLQAYTGFVYTGPSFARRISEGLAELLKDKGFESWDSAVGSECKGSNYV